MLLKALLIVPIVLVCLFVLTFAIYWFILDMKLINKVYFALQKHYDNMKRDRKL